MWKRVKPPPPEKGSVKYHRKPFSRSLAQVKTTSSHSFLHPCPASSSPSHTTSTACICREAALISTRPSHTTIPRVGNGNDGPHRAQEAQLQSASAGRDQILTAVAVAGSYNPACTSATSTTVFGDDRARSDSQAPSGQWKTTACKSEAGAEEETRPRPCCTQYHKY